MDTITEIERLLKRAQDFDATEEQSKQESAAARNKASRLLMSEVLKLMPMKELKTHLDISWAMLSLIKTGQRKMNPEVRAVLLAILKESAR